LRSGTFSLSSRRDHVYKIFEGQTEINLANVQKLYTAVGNQVSVVNLTGTDFGAQNGPLVSPQTYRNLFLPFHKKVNDWVQSQHNVEDVYPYCGSVWALVDDFIAAGFDILNPVQCSAARMNPYDLKSKFGDRITFGEVCGYAGNTSLWLTPGGSARKSVSGSGRLALEEALSLTPSTNIQALVPGGKCVGHVPHRT